MSARRSLILAGATAAAVAWLFLTRGPAGSPSKGGQRLQSTLLLVSAGDISGQAPYAWGGNLEAFLSTTVEMSQAAIDEKDGSDVTALEKELETRVSAVGVTDMPYLIARLSAAEPSAARLALGRRLIRRWAELEPEAAGAVAGALPPGPFGRALVGQVASTWSNLNTAAASQWAHALLTDEFSTTALTRVGFEMVRAAPVAALRIATELRPNRERNDLVLQSAGEWAAHDPITAAAWAMRLTDDLLRGEVVGAIVTAWSAQDPVAAANFALETLPAGRIMNDAIVGVVQRWAQVDPAQTADWVGRFTESPMRRDAAENLVALWAPRDILAAGLWLRQLAAGNSRDVAVSTYVSQLALTGHPPQVIGSWIDAIADSTLRETARMMIVGVW